MWVKMWVSGLTHTVTHTRKGNNGHKRAGQEALCFLPGFFLSALHDLLYEVPHGLGGFELRAGGDVGVVIRFPGYTVFLAPCPNRHPTAAAGCKFSAPLLQPHLPGHRLQTLLHFAPLPLCQMSPLHSNGDI